MKHDKHNSDKDVNLTDNQPKKKRHIIRNIIIIILCVAAAAAGGAYWYIYNTIDNVEQEPLDKTDLGIEPEEEKVFDDYRNIALFGIDTRQNNYSGRSDAIVVLTVDKTHNKIKLTSIARDSYVNIEGRSQKDKINHAYAYGRSQLAVKTLNQNFDLAITDYVTVNFYGLVHVIDYIGGVTIDVSEAELSQINGLIFGMGLNGLKGEPLSSAGVQKLSGAQAVAYSRIRYIDSDIERGNRQKEVLMAMFESVKQMSPLALPKVAELVAKECVTSLSTNDIIALGTWGLTASPEFEQLSIPNKNFPSSGQMIGGVYYYVYDLELAKKDIHDFIREENFYSPTADLTEQTEGQQ